MQIEYTKYKNKIQSIKISNILSYEDNDILFNYLCEIGANKYNNYERVSKDTLLLIGNIKETLQSRARVRVDIKRAYKNCFGVIPSLEVKE